MSGRCCGRRIGCVLAMVWAALWLAASAGGAPLRAGEPKALPLEVAWDLPLPQPVVRSWVSPQVPELVFFQLAGTHEIHCVELQTGVTRWVSEPLPGAAEGDPFVQRQLLPGQREREVIVDDRLYVIIQDVLHCFDVATGQRIWRLELPFSASTGAVFAGPTEGSARGFIGDWTGKIQVVGLHQPLTAQQKKFPFIAWQMPTAGIVRAAPVEREQLIYASDTAGFVRCYRLERSLVWERDLGGAIDGGVTVRQRVVYAGTAANAVVALDAMSGEQLGKLHLRGAVRRRPFWFPGDGDRLYVWIDNPDPRIGGLTAILAQADTIARADASKFAVPVQRMGVLWQVGSVDALIGATPLHLYLTERRTRRVIQVHRGSGEIQSTFSAQDLLPEEQTIQGVVSHQHGFAPSIPVIAYSRQGWVRCWRAYGFIPTPEQERQGITSRAALSAERAPTSSATP
ncbi:MAG: PQQ-binding-like beta-propeller repeat protein [Planctomycetota bacterium]|nr:PQQ-binding-like beta-propeller repeat protein [Planctomycetota bacterium]